MSRNEQPNPPLPDEVVRAVEACSDGDRPTCEDEAGELILAACQAALEIELGKRASGLSPSEPAPWPQSTWDFFKRAAQNVRAKA